MIRPTHYRPKRHNTYAKDWESLAFQSDYITRSYGNQGTWGLYNLFASKLLNPRLVSDRVRHLFFGILSSSLCSTMHWFLKVLNTQALWYVNQAESGMSSGPSLQMFVVTRMWLSSFRSGLNTTGTTQWELNLVYPPVLLKGICGGTWSLLNFRLDNVRRSRRR